VVIMQTSVQRTTNVIWKYAVRVEAVGTCGAQIIHDMWWIPWRQIWRPSVQNAIRKHQEKDKTAVKIRWLK